MRIVLVLILVLGALPSHACPPQQTECSERMECLRAALEGQWEWRSSGFDSDPTTPETLGHTIELEIDARGDVVISFDGLPQGSARIELHACLEQNPYDPDLVFVTDLPLPLPTEAVCFINGDAMVWRLPGWCGNVPTTRFVRAGSVRLQRMSTSTMKSRFSS